MRFPKLISGGIAAAVLTAAVGGAAFAQTTPVPSATAVPPQQRAREFLDAIASKLGKTPTEITAAVTAVQKERVAADVAAGRITQAQADAANARIDAAGAAGLFGHGPGGKGHGGGGPKGGPGGEMRGGRVGGAELATFLGATPQEIAAAMQSGKSLAVFAEEKGKSRDDLKAYLTTQERTGLSAAVAAGRLTQAQADARLAQFTSQLDAMIDRTGPVGGPGGRGERGRGGPGAGQRGGVPGAPGAAPSATVTPTRA
jgi:hypothetical protein